MEDMHVGSQRKVAKAGYGAITVVRDGGIKYERRRRELGIKDH
ncbi:hypothetical protein AGRA671_27825 [Agrobacterium radiobacter]|jgi:hypothetical protein|nr:Uncharacterised protein [Agrobacterium tumefaciens]